MHDPKQSGARRRPRRLLVVDDDAGCREVLALALGQADYEVELADGGVEALELLTDRSAPDAVLLDLMMPGIDGFQVLAAIRATPALAGLPVVIVSASVNDRTAIPGADAVLAKPFDFDRIVEVLGLLCEATATRVA